MNYYILNFILIIILYILIKISKIKNKKQLFIIISFLQLFIFLGFRNDDIGIDLKNYLEAFNLSQYANYYKIVTFEKGYMLYNQIIYYIFNGNFQMFLIITAFLCLIGVYNFIKENSCDYLLSILMYVALSYYMFIFSGLRQGIAISIILYSIKYIKQEKPIKFIILVLIAATFHKTALIFLLAYFLKKIKINSKIIVVLIASIPLILYFKGTIITVITKYVYTAYSALGNQGGGYTLLILYIGILIFLTIYKNELLKIDENNNLWYNFFVITVLIQVFATVEGNIYRLAYYYAMSIILLVPQILKTIKKSRQRFLSKCFIILFLTLYYSNTMLNSVYYTNYSMFIN